MFECARLTASYTSKSEARNVMDSSRINQLLINAVENGHAENVKSLLSQGANANARDVLSGVTALHLASARGDGTVVADLLQGGAQVDDFANNTETSPLGVAAIAGHADIVSLLASCGASLSHAEGDLIEEVIANGDIEIAAILERHTSE